MPLVVEEREVLAIWMKMAAIHLPHTATAFANAVIRCAFGRNQIKRDFLLSGDTSHYITRGVNNNRQSSTVVFLDKLAPELKSMVKVFTTMCKTLKSMVKVFTTMCKTLETPPSESCMHNFHLTHMQVNQLSWLLYY